MGAYRQERAAGVRVIVGVVAIIVGLFVVLGLGSYDWHDIGVLQVPPTQPASNLIGPVGAWLAYGLFMTFGVGAFLVAAWLLAVGAILLRDRIEERVWPRLTWCTLFFLAVIVLLEVRADLWVGLSRRLNIEPLTTGFFGMLLTQGVLLRGIGKVGTALVAGGLALTAFVMTVRTGTLLRGYELAGGGWSELRQRLGAFLARQREARRVARAAAAAAAEDRLAAEPPDPEPEPEPELEPEPERLPEPEPEPEPAPAPEEPAGRRRKKGQPPPTEGDYPDPDVPVRGAGRPYTKPSVTLLNQPGAPASGNSAADVERTSRILVDTLQQFKVEVNVTGVERGPVVTRYELLPARGVKVERIANLANNLALSLKATSVRVQAPIPGKGVVGVEVPNATARLVVMREIIEGDVWRKGKAALPLVVGKDVGGTDVVIDLAALPHLLIAGATGTGKSVCMNAMLAGLLMARTPDELRLMLVDPKIVEFSMYNDLPHLVVPVITDSKKVALGLRWAIREMEKRYKLFNKAGVRNIEAFNVRLKQPVARQVDMFGGEEAAAVEDSSLPATVPYIVIVIDELADLMLVDQAEIEQCVARLAQLSRAVGIHMVIATQRPSVDVITGVIKANFPARIAFKVAQKVDSRTIIDGMGAETLLGRGDMLLMPQGGNKMMRVQGAMITDEEIKRVVQCIKDQVAPDYEMEIKQTIEKPLAGDGEGGGGGESDEGDGGEDEVLLEKAIAIVRETRRASTSSLQRRLRIGYTRAARLMDIMEERGIVGPPRGSDPREILIDLDGAIPNNAATESLTTDEN